MTPFLPWPAHLGHGVPALAMKSLLISQSIHRSSSRAILSNKDEWRTNSSWWVITSFLINSLWRWCSRAVSIRSFSSSTHSWKSLCNLLIFSIIPSNTESFFLTPWSVYQLAVNNNNVNYYTIFKGLIYRAFIKLLYSKY